MPRKNKRLKTKSEDAGEQPPAAVVPENNLLSDVAKAAAAGRAAYAVYRTVKHIQGDSEHKAPRPQLPRSGSRASPKAGPALPEKSKR